MKSIKIKMRIKERKYLRVKLRQMKKQENKEQFRIPK